MAKEKPLQQPLLVLSTLALRPALSRILLTGHSRHERGRPLARFEAGSLLVRSLQADDTNGHIFAGPESITLALVARGVLQAGASVALVHSETAFAVRESHPVPRLSDGPAIEQLLRGATAVCRSRAASGRHLEHLAHCLGLSQLLETKSLVPPPGELVGHVLARSDADVGFQQVSEFQQFDGLRILRLPAGHRHRITYLLTPFSHCSAQAGLLEQVLELMAYIGAPRFDPVWRMSGLEPVRDS